MCAFSATWPSQFKCLGLSGFQTLAIAVCLLLLRVALSITVPGVGVLMDAQALLRSSAVKRFRRLKFDWAVALADASAELQTVEVVSSSGSAALEARQLRGVEVAASVMPGIACW